MKKLLLLVAITLTTSFTAFAQQSENLESLTTGKWNIEVVEIENEVIDVKNEGHWMVFYADGFYELLLDDEGQVGTWELDEELTLKFDSETKNEKSSIQKINNKELKFSISGYTLALTK